MVDSFSPPDSWYENPAFNELPCPDCYKEQGLSLNDIMDDEVQTCKAHIMERKASESDYHSVDWNE